MRWFETACGTKEAEERTCETGPGGGSIGGRREDREVLGEPGPERSNEAPQAFCELLQEADPRREASGRTLSERGTIEGNGWHAVRFDRQDSSHSISASS